MTSYDRVSDAEPESGDVCAILTAAAALTVMMLLAPLWGPVLGVCWLLDRRAARTWRRQSKGVGATSEWRRASRLTGARRADPSADVAGGGGDLLSPPPASRGGLCVVAGRHGRAGLHAVAAAIAATTRDGTEQIERWTDEDADAHQWAVICDRVAADLEGGAP